MPRISATASAALLALLAPIAQASTTFIDFEAFPNGSTVSNEYPGVVFSSSGTVVEVSDYGQPDWGTSGPKIACPLGDPRGYCSAALTVDFLTTVTSVGYLYTGDDTAGHVGTADYYRGATLLTSHMLMGDGNAISAQADSFADSAGITRLVITVSDMEADVAGLGYDDFRLAPVPEPETYALMLGGLALVGWMTRHRRIG